MKQSAQQQLTDHMTAMLAKSAVQTVEDCPACNGDGITGHFPNNTICTTCNGQRVVVKNSR